MFLDCHFRFLWLHALEWPQRQQGGKYSPCVNFLSKRRNDQSWERGVLKVWHSVRPTCPVSLIELFLARSQTCFGKYQAEELAQNCFLATRSAPSYYDCWDLSTLAKSYGLHSLHSGGAATTASSGALDRWWLEVNCCQRHLHLGVGLLTSFHSQDAWCMSTSPLCLCFPWLCGRLRTHNAVGVWCHFLGVVHVRKYVKSVQCLNMLKNLKSFQALLGSVRHFIFYTVW